MTFQFGQDLEMDQLRTNHNISKILTTLSVKKRRAATKRDDKGGIAGFSIVLDTLSYHPSCNTSLNSKTEKYLNKGGVNKLW